MIMYSINLVIKLNTLAHHYKDVINRTLNEVLKQPRYKNTGQGLASLHVEVIDGDQTKSPQIIITMDDHLVIMDKRKLQWTKQPPVEEISEWVKTKGNLTVPGYKNGTADKLPPWKAQQRIAWAIAKSKQKYDTHYGKPWRKKSLGNTLREMNKMIVKGFDEAIEMDLQKAIKV